MARLSVTADRGSAGVRRVAPTARPQRRALVPVALALALVLAACGSSAPSSAGAGAKVSAARYVTALCQAVGPFERDVVARSAALTGAGSVTPTKGKALLVDYLRRLSSDSAAAVDKLGGAGTPTVNGGARFANTILSTFTRLKRALLRSEQVAAQLPTSSEPAFKRSAGTLATAVKDSVGQLGQGLSAKSNKALDAAAAKVGACHAL